MATTNTEWTIQAGWPRDNTEVRLYYSADDDSAFGTSGDARRFNVPHGLPENCRISRVQVTLGRFDSDNTPTGVWDVVLTNGSTEFELISAAEIGRLAVGDSAISPGGGRTADECLGFRQDLSDDWYILLRQGAALATATTTGRAVELLVWLHAVA